MPTLGLSQIVKNEAHVIERMLNTISPILDYVALLIQDQQMVHKILSEITAKKETYHVKLLIDHLIILKIQEMLQCNYLDKRLIMVFG